MDKYLKWDTRKLNSFDEKEINNNYNEGFVFVRTEKGRMEQTRSLRIVLNDFEFNGKNRRVFRKVPDLTIENIKIPLDKDSYTWQIHKLGKDYYDKKFGKNIFSASKIKELVTDQEKSNYNLLLKYTEKGNTIGYCICYENTEILHYAYPFYDFEKYFNHYGMGMMLLAIKYAIESNKKYVYLGSVTKPFHTFKLQFKALEWFDGSTWKTDLEELKNIIVVPGSNNNLEIS